MLNFSPGGFWEILIIWPFFAIGLGILYAITFRETQHHQ
jgi:hypothetical protein